MKFLDVPQNEDRWFELRAGKLTGSKFGTIMANNGKAFGEPAKKYAANIALEQITGRAISSDYSNAHMERGHEQEPLARMRYEEQFFCEVTNGGFFDCGDTGVSPDGLVGDDGVIEIKSVIPSVHYASIKRQSFDPAYKWQLIGNLKSTQRDWIDFVSYCADYPEDKQLFVFRLNKEHYKKEFEEMAVRTAEFIQLVSDTKEAILNNDYQLASKGKL